MMGHGEQEGLQDRISKIGIIGALMSDLSIRALRYSQLDQDEETPGRVIKFILSEER
jgi:hypothetical protein